MFWNKYLMPALGALVLVAVLNQIGQSELLFWTSSWYDWPVHFVGGVAVALGGLWAINTQYLKWFKRFLTPTNLVFAVFIVGIIWEIYELSFGLTYWTSKGYAWDTTHDLLMDLCGSIAVAWYARRSMRLLETSETSEQALKTNN